LKGKGWYNSNRNSEEIVVGIDNERADGNILDADLES